MLTPGALKTRLNTARRTRLCRERRNGPPVLRGLFHRKNRLASAEGRSIMAAVVQHYCLEPERLPLRCLAKGVFSMSFFRSLFGFRSSMPSSRSARKVVVDATSFAAAENKGRPGGFQPNPRDHFNTLRFLADLAAREQLDITAVFTGRPLREAPDGKPYKNITAYYAENAGAMEERILGLVRQFGPRETLVVGMSPGLEQKAMDLGAMCMRTSTVRKALEEKERQPQQNRRRPRNEAPPQNTAGDDDGNEDEQEDEPGEDQGSQDSREPRPREQRNGNGGRDREQRRDVLDLIDPV